MIGSMIACFEALAFSSMLAASVAGALTLAAAFSLTDNPSLVAAGLAFSGTLAVYNLDRLRDLERDRRLSPRRSVFVSDHRTALIGLLVLGAGAATAFAWRAGPAAAALCAAVLLPALFHRRIKRHPGVKAAYVTTAWVGVVVGLPALEALAAPLGAPGGGRIALIACVYGSAIGANLIASNERDSAELSGAQRAIWGARGLAALGVLIALAGPPALRTLACIPLAQLASLTGFRGGERRRLIVIDGALLLGALAALSLQ